MPIRVYKPTSAGRRNASVNMHAEVTKHAPEKSLLLPKPKKGGRNRVASSQSFTGAAFGPGAAFSPR